jgi:hypothetical protein
MFRCVRLCLYGLKWLTVTCTKMILKLEVFGQALRIQKWSDIHLPEYTLW